MSYNSKRNSFCSNGCVAFVLKQNVNNYCANCLFNAFYNFVNKEKSNGVSKYHESDYLLRKAAKL